MNDQSIADSIITYLTAQGATATSEQQVAGVLVLADYRGTSLTIQVRKPGKHMTNQQLEFSRQVQRTGNIHIVAHGPAEVQRTMTHLDEWERARRRRK